MRIRLYFDEDSMDRRLVASLRSRQVDVQTAEEAGQRGQSDYDQLEHATAQGRVLCSYNISHFSDLHKEFLDQGKSHAGIIVVRQQRYSIGDRMRKLLALLAAHTEESMRDNLEHLSAW